MLNNGDATILLFPSLTSNVEPVESSLTLANIAALSGIMAVGALIPGVSALTVSARSVAFGFAHGCSVSLGIVAGDVVFILIAINGLSVLVDMMGSQFVLIKYLGGAYLIWLGVTLCRAKSPAGEFEEKSESSLLSSFMTGLLITLGDQKAILFYLGFFPAFVDMSRISLFDTGIIVAVAVAAVGGPKLVYAFMADRARLLVNGSRATRTMNLAAGSAMLAVGVLLFAMAWAG